MNLFNLKLNQYLLIFILSSAFSSMLMGAPQSDSFNGNTLSDFWQQMDTEDLIQPAEDHIILDGSELTLGVRKNADPWYQGDEAFFLYQTHTGPFDITTRVRVRDWANPSNDSSNSYAFGGIMVRSASSQDYYFVVIGRRGGSNQVETKVTDFPVSAPKGYNTPDGEPDGQLRLVRDAEGNMTAYSKTYDASGESEWVQRAISTNRTGNLGNVNTDEVQIGIIGYGYWASTDFRAIFDYFNVEGSEPAPEPEVDSFTASPTGIIEDSGDDVTLNWATTNATSVSIDQGIGSVSVDGSAVVNPNATTTYTITASDGGNTVTDTVTVTVNPANQAPTASAGSDQNVDEGDNVALDASASSDSDGSISSYSWEQISGSPTVSLSNASSASASFTAPTVGSSGTSLSFRITVTDNGGLQDSDTVVVNVNNVNIAPVADAGANQNVDEGDIVQLSASDSSDADGTIASYSWSQTSGTSVSLSDSSSATPSFTAPQVGSSGESLEFEVLVTDNDGASSTDEIVIQVSDTASNNVPNAQAGSNQQVNEGETVSLSGSSSSDSDGTIVSYSWTQDSGTTVVLSNASSVTASFVAPQVSSSGENLSFTLTVTDDDGATHSDSLQIDVDNVNVIPVAEAGSDQIVSVGSQVQLNAGSSSDSDGSIVSFAWSQSSGESVTLSNGSSSTPSFDAPLVVGDLVFSVQVVDDLGASHQDTVRVTVQGSLSEEEQSGDDSGGEGSELTEEELSQISDLEQLDVQDASAVDQALDQISNLSTRPLSLVQVEVVIDVLGRISQNINSLELVEDQRNNMLQSTRDIFDLDSGSEMTNEDRGQILTMIESMNQSDDGMSSEEISSALSVLNQMSVQKQEQGLSDQERVRFEDLTGNFLTQLQNQRDDFSRAGDLVLGSAGTSVAIHRIDFSSLNNFVEKGNLDSGGVIRLPRSVGGFIELADISIHARDWDAHGVEGSSPISGVTGFTFRQAGGSVDEVVQGLIEPITIMMKVDPGLIQGDAVPMYYDETAQVWATQGIKLVSFDQQTGVVTFTTDHLTDFAIFSSGTESAGSAISSVGAGEGGGGGGCFLKY